MPLKWIPLSKPGALKSRPHWAAHTHIGNVWENPGLGINTGGDIEIPCFYQIEVKKGLLKSLTIELRAKLVQLVPTSDNTI